MTSTETTRTELVWPGKYDENGRRQAPPPGRCTLRRLDGPATDGPPATDPWVNQLILGDNLAALHALRPDLAGRVDLIYIDPPFAAGASYDATGPTAGQDPPAPARLVTDRAFRAGWGGDAGPYLQHLYDRLTVMRDLLAPRGTLFVHCDARLDWGVRCLLDEIFGRERLINQIIWHYTGGGRSRRYFSRKHDVIFWVAKSDGWTFHLDAVRQPYKATSRYARAGIVSAAGKRYLPHPGGTPADDVWDIPIVNPMSAERLGYPSQKPERLLERIIRAASSPDDLVADFYCGSGTTPAVAERLGRRWVACDAAPVAVQMTRARLRDLAGCRPFGVWATAEPATVGDD